MASRRTKRRRTRQRGAASARMPSGADARSTLYHQPCHRATGKQDQDGPRTLRGTPSKIELWAGTRGSVPTCADDSSHVTAAATAQARIDVENECEPGTDSQPITIKGFSYQISAAKALINESLNAPPSNVASAGYALGGTGAYAPPPQAGYAASATGYSPPMNGPPRVEVTEMIAIKTVTRVIGKGGSIIKDIRARSGCHINIDSNAADKAAGTQPVVFSGTDSQVQLALELVRQIMQEVQSEAGAGHSMAPPAAALGLESTISCPKEWIGRVVGPKGGMIQQIRQQARKQIARPHCHKPLRISSVSSRVIADGHPHRHRQPRGSSAARHASDSLPSQPRAGGAIARGAQHGQPAVPGGGGGHLHDS